MKRKHFILALAAMLMSFSFSAYAEVFKVSNEAELRAALTASGVQRSAARQRSAQMRSTGLGSLGVNTIEVTGDVVITEPITTNVGSESVINLNGHTIQGAEVEGGATKHLYPIYNLGTLTINDGTAKGGVIDCGIYNGYSTEDGIVAEAVLVMNGGSIVCHDVDGAAIINYGTATINAGTVEGVENALWNKSDATMTVKSGALVTGGLKEDNDIIAEEGVLVVAKINGVPYTSLNDAFTAAVDGETITLLRDATPVLTSQGAITKAAVIDLGGKKLTLTEDDLYFGTTTFKNGTIVVDPSVVASTAVFWMFENQTLTFDNVDIVATGVTGTYLIGINGGTGTAVNIINGSSITIENSSTAGLTAVIADNGTGNTVTISDSEIAVENIEGRFYLGGKEGTVTVESSDVDLDGVKEGFYLRAGQTLDVTGNSTVDITLNSTDGRYGINLTDFTSAYTKAGTATVNATIGELQAAAQIGTTKYLTLQAAINAAVDGDEIVLKEDITEDVTITQKANLDLVINGDGKRFTGVMTINGGGRSAGEETLTIKNVEFHAVDGKNACITTATAAGGTYSYAHNVTVEACTFKGNDTYSYNNTFAIRYPSGETGFGLTVKDCTVDDKMFGFIWVSNVENGLFVENCTAVGVQEGINLTQTPKAEIKNSTISAKVLAIRAGQSSGAADGKANEITLKENQLTSENNVIILRGEAVDANLSMYRNAVSGTTHISGNTAATKLAIDANYWGGDSAPVVAEGSPAINVNSYYSDEALSNLVRNHFGGSIVGYTTDYRIWGDAWGNAFESYVVKVLDAEGNVMGTTSLNNVNGIINGDVNVTWGINFVGASNDPYWTWEWTRRPSITNMPAKVQLWIDDEQVAEGPVKLNAPDDLKKIVAATADADGNIIGCYTTLNDAVAKGDHVAILVAGTYSVPTGKDLTITGAVDGVMFDNIGAKNMGGADVTFNNVTFDYYPNVNYTGLQHSGNLVYNNCTINGQVFLYGQSETFNQCTFNQNSADAYNVWTYGAKEVAFNECTFESAGKSVLVYSEDKTLFNNVTVESSTFNASAPVDGKAAIEMDASLTAGANVTITNSTVTGFGTGNVSGNSLWNNKKGNADADNNDITVTVDGDVVLQPVFDAQIGTAQYRTLGEAISAVKDGETITLLRDVAYDVTITQTADVDVTIDGNGKKFDGTIYLQGNSRHTGAETLTIKNINFETADAVRDFISCNDGGDAQIRYAHNVTVENCNFTATAENNTVVATRFRQCYNMKIVGGTFTNLFSPMWATGGNNITVEGVEVPSSVEGLSFGTATNVSVKNVELTAQMHGVRVDASQATSLTVSGSKINAFIPVVARYATADYAIVMADNNEFTATNEDGLWCAVGATEYKENGAVPSDATGVVTVALNGTGLVANGVNGLKARIGNVYYFSYEKAYEAAQPGETVTILAANITGNLDVKKAITVQGETDAEGNNLVNYTGKLNITADGATVKNINFNNGSQTAGYINAKDVTVDGCQVVGGNGFRYCYTKGTVTFKNSVITGATYGIHFDGSEGGNIVIDNCTITGWTSFAGTINKVKMTDTEFAEGNYNYVRFYQKEVEISGCEFNEDMAVDLATNEAKVTVDDCTVENKTVEDLFYGEDIVNSTITVDGVELIRIAKVGDVYYETITEAINAAADGATVEILAGEHSEYVAPWAGNSKHDTEKSITIVGAADFATTLTAGMYLGYDDSQCREHNIVVKGIVFKGKGLKVACQQNVTIENNKFIGITEGQAIAVVGKNINSVVKNNVIENVAAAQGIELRNTLTATVEGNTISGTAHNSLQITSEVGATNSTATVLNNTLSDWGLGGEGRAMRIHGIVTATVNGNVMTHSATAPEEYVKVTTATTLDASQNYWAGVNPIIDGMFNTDMVADRAALLKNYYVDADKQTLADISASPVMIGETYYRTFAAALDAVQDGETIILTGAAGSELKTEIEFTKDIAFTITGTAPQYALPVITFLNAEVTIKNAEILIPELDARQNAVINVVNSTVHDAGGDGIVKSYFNGAINIDATSTVYTMQVTTMGYINVAGTLNATWQTNVYGNGMITLAQGATFNTAGLNLTAQANSDRDNTDTERVGKPATIVVDGATFIAGKAYSESGADYSYNADKYGLNVGTVDGKFALLDIKNGATVKIYTGDGKTANFGAGATVNVDASTLNVACRATDGVATLDNAGTVNVSGASNLAAAKVTGNGWFYMNGVTLDANTNLIGAKVGFINGENTVKGSTIKDGWFSVGIGQNAEAEKAAAFAQANGITLGDVTVNVSDNATIGGNGETYSGWVGSAYSADKTQHTYALNVENSLAAFGYMHVSKDGTFTVDGRSADDNKYTYDNANVNFYAGDFIINGVVTLNNADVWARTAKISVDHVGGVLNINGDTKFEASRHNGATTGDAFVYYKAGEVNVAETATVEIDNATKFVEGAVLNIAGNVTAKGAITANGAINFTSDVATLTTATTGLTIGYDLNKDKKVVYAEGAYKVAEKLYVAQIDDAKYETLAAAVAAVEDGGTITMIANETFTENNRYDNGGWWDGLGYSGDKSFTIDLNNFTISQDGALNDYLMWFKNDGAKDNTITLKNGTLDAGTTAYCALATASSNAKKITVNLENISLINNNSNGSTVKVRGGAVLNVKAGTVITGKNSYLGIECVASTVNIYDGAEIYMNGTSSYNGCLVGACAAGTVNVYGGYGKGVKGGFIAMTSGGTINVTGGEWIANTDGTVGNNSNLYVLTAQSNKNESGFAGPSIINVTGGTFRGGMDAWVLNNVEGEKAELNISGGNFNANPTSYVAEDYIAVENNGVWNVVKAAVKVGDTYYASLEAGLKALTDGATLTFIEDITVTEAWDCRNNGAKVTVANVTIDGNGKTLKIAGAVDDRNWNTVFRFEGDNATVKNLTIDASAATGIDRGITSKLSVTVDSCTLVGNGTTAKRAIIFGEGAGTSISNVVATVTNSTFKNWSYGVSDNQNNQDAKSVTVSGNTFENASVLVSASELVKVEDNTLDGGSVNITSYTNADKVNVQAYGNTLDSNLVNEITVNPANIFASGFNISVAKNGKYYTSLQEAIDKVENGDVITVVVNTKLTLNEAVTVEGKTITLNLNGKKILAAEDATMTGGPIRLLDGANLTINGEGEISNNGNENVYAAVSVLGNNVKLTVNGGKLIGHYYGIAGNGYKTETEVTINGGVITSGASDGLGIYHPQAGSLTVTGGEITGATGIYFKGGELYIEGGTIKGTGESVEYEYNGSGCVATGDALVIENAVANGYAAIDSVSITGGTFHSVKAAPVASYAPEASDALVEFIGEGCNAQFNNTFDESLLVVGYQLTKAEGAEYFGVEHTQKRESLTIVDGAYAEFVNKEELTIGTLTYERTLMKSGVWQSLYVPFEIPVEELTKLGYEAAFFYDVHFDVIEGGVIDPESYPEVHLIKIKQGTLKAHYPYVIRASKDADLNLSLVLENTKLYTTEESKMNSVESGSTINRFIFAGTYKKATPVELTGNASVPCYAITNSGIFAQVPGTSKISEFRVYMTIITKDGSPVILNDVTAGAIKMRAIGEENEDGTTTIYDVEADEQTVDYIYDLQGRRVLEPQKGGLYIVNGKKVIF